MIHISRAETRRTVHRGPFTSRFLPLGRLLDHHEDHGLAQIGRLEHATLEGGALVPMHMHQNEEILSYLRSGTMYHKDSDQNDLGIHKGHMMLMNAGSGIHHEEGVPHGAETVEMLQIFIRPREDGMEPMVQFQELDDPYSRNVWRLLAGHEGADAPMLFRSQVLFHDARLENGMTLPTPDLDGKVGLLYLFHGRISLGASGETASKGDSIVIKDEILDLAAKETSDLVFFVLNETAPFSRNGLFAK